MDERRLPDRCFRVSIHAPPEGRDMAAITPVMPIIGFNPRAPGGARFSSCFSSP